MKGWEIFVHSVRLVFSNIDAAFKISALPYALSGLAFIFLGAEASRLMSSGDQALLMQAPASLWMGYVAYGLLSVIVALWIAVAWHRFVLLEEYPKGWVPAFHGSAILSYFVRGLLIGLLIIGALLVVTMVLGLLLAFLGPVGVVLITLISGGIAAFVFYRLCPVLPSAAVGRPMTFGEAWKATEDSTSTILVLVLLLIVSSFIVQLPNQIGGADTLIGIIYSLVIGWFMMLIGASVLTTFYGHFIEGRPID